MSLEERKFRLEERKFEFEVKKSRGLGFFNSNFGIIITAIIGIGTVAVSYIQLRISNRSSLAQSSLDITKENHESDRDDRKFEFELASLLLEKENNFNTSDERQIPYLRDIVLNTLPKDFSIRIARTMAQNAPNQRVRSCWNDVIVNLRTDVVEVNSPPIPPSRTDRNQTLRADDILRKFPSHADDAAERIQGLLDAARELKFTDQQTTMFLVLCFNNTQGFVSLVENLNYTVQGLRATWPNRFASDTDAARFANQPEQIADHVYGGRLGNDTLNDGWKFRGRGPLQTTGKERYRAVGAKIGVDLVDDPDALLDPRVGARAAAAEFVIDDALPPASAGDLRGVIYHVNGGFNGLAQAEAMWQALSPGAPDLTQGLTIATGAPNDAATACGGGQ